MAPPVVTVTLGGTDISARVKSPKGTPTMVYGRGASFDGGSESPGYAVLTVANNDKAFNPRNAGSTLASVLKLGKAVRVTAVWSATTYYLFHGFLRRLVPLDDGFAELHCEDALFNLSRRETNVGASVDRSIRSFRGAILDDVGEDPANRNLANSNGAEAGVVFTGADGANALDLLQSLNQATGTVHYVKPTSTAYQYTTLDRADLQSTASVESWSDTDFANPFAATLGMFDLTDERIINKQRVEATPRLLEDDPTTVWSRHRIQVAPNATKVRWARYDEPTFERVWDYTTESGSATVTRTHYTRATKYEVAAGVSGVVLKDLKITGRRALPVELDAGISEDGASQTAYGVLRGQPISSDYISSEAYAEGLGDWYTFRYKDPRANAAPTFINRFPTQLQREIGERITYTSAEHSLTAIQFLIRSFETEVSDSGATWKTTYQLEEMPATVSLFTVGGSAPQGVGGTGVLAI